MTGEQFGQVIDKTLNDVLPKLSADNPLLRVRDAGEMVDYPVMLRLPRLFVALMSQPEFTAKTRPAHLIEEALCNMLSAGPLAVLQMQLSPVAMTSLIIAYAEIKKGAENAQ